MKYLQFFLQVSFLISSIGGNLLQGSMDRAQPPLIRIIKGDIQSVFADGQDITEVFKKLIMYTVRFSKWKAPSKSWMNDIFQGDPSTGARKYCYVKVLFADGSMAHHQWQENTMDFPDYPKPFQILSAAYVKPKNNNNAQEGQVGFDVTRAFQENIYAKLKQDAIRQIKNPTERASLQGMWDYLSKAKNIEIQWYGQEKKVVSLKALQDGWEIKTTLCPPHMKPIGSLKLGPQWTPQQWSGSKAGQSDRTIEKVFWETDPKHYEKEMKALQELPAELGVLENQNELLAKEEKVAVQKDKK